MAVSRRKNAAFTLVELLVVISILGVLMALLLPAVNAVRESMRRTTCKNNLKQIGNAANQHLTAYGFFPSSGWGSSWTGDPDHGVGRAQPGGWIYNILPFMGLDMIHDKGKGLSASTNPTKISALGEAMSAGIPVLICPTRRRGVAYPGSGSAVNGTSPATLTKTDYAANGGSNVFTGAGPAIGCLTTYPSGCAWSNPNQSTGGTSSFNGISGERSEVPAGAVTDGLSYCIFAGEKYLDPAYYYTGASGVENNSALQGNDYETNRWVAAPPQQDALGVNTTNCTIFGSAHPAGYNFVFCDGSVHLVSTSMSGTGTNAITIWGTRNYIAANPGPTAILPELP